MTIPYPRRTRARAALRRFLTVITTVGVSAALLVGAPVGASAAAAGGAPEDLRIEFQPSPMELENLTAPKFSWLVGTGADQSAYRIAVASTLEQAGEAPDVWDSGRQDGSSSANVAYSGPELEPSERYWWTVKTWDTAGVESDWAPPVYFSTGPGADWGDTETVWVGQDKGWGSDYTLELRAQFTQKHVTVAFRAADSSNHYLWQFRGDGANELATHAVTSANASAPEVLKTVPLGVDIENGADARFYDIRLSVQGPTIKTYLDGDLIDTSVNGTFNAGGFGFRTGGSESFVIDDVRMSDGKGVSVYENDFSVTEFNDFGCGEFRDGALFIPNGLRGGCIYYGPWSDYDVEFEASVTATALGVLLRARDERNNLMWQIRGADSQIAPHTRINGTFAALERSSRIEPAIGTNRMNDYRFSLRGDVVTTFVNDVEVDSRSVPGFRTGGIGFRNGNSETGEVKNLRVSTPRDETVYANDFAADSDDDFTCATKADGVLSVPRGADCVIASMPGSVPDWAFLRGEFTTQDKEIAWASLYATGSSTDATNQYVYRTWVNGEYVGLGPTQPMAGENRYDGFDVTSLLRSGETNAIGALAYTTRHEHQFMAHLVVEYSDGSTQTFGSGAGWTSLDGTSVFPAAGSIGTGFYTAPVENIDGRKYPHGFSEPGFDDANWRAADVTPQMDRLVATPFAKVQEHLKSPVNIVKKAEGHYFLDFGRTWLGGMRLDLPGGEGHRVELRYGEELTDQDTTANTVRWQMRTGNTYRDTYTLGAGDAALQNWGVRVFRYAEILNSPVEITQDNVHATALIYPFVEDAAVFDSSSDALDSVWQLSRNTIEALNLNLYVDTWSRERINYEADSFIQLQSHIYLDADPTLAQYSMEYLLTRRTWPTEWPMYVILGMHELWQSTGDASLMERTYDQIKAKLPSRYLEESTGLIRKTSGSDGGNSKTDDDIVDWPAGERDGYQFRQYNTVVNALAYKSYRDMADMAAATGHDDDAAEYTAIADRMRAAINEHLYDPVKGAYRDGMDAAKVPTEHWALHASVFTQAFDVTPDTERVRVGEYLATRGMECSVYCAPFLLQALYDGNQGEAAYELMTSTGIRSWLNMIEQGAGATMEAWDTSLKSNTSFSHPWASSPAFMLPRGMFGIQSVEAGYRVFSVKPQPGGLETAHVSVPTARGAIDSAFDTVDGRIDLGVNVPRGTTANVTIPKGDAEENVVYIDGQPNDAALLDGFLTVEGVASGCHIASTSDSLSLLENDRLLAACVDGYAGPILDTTEPTISAGYVPDSVNGWIPAGATLTLSADDDMSGVESIEYRIDDAEWVGYAAPTELPDGQYSVQYRATDAAGNVSAVESDDVRVDTAPPNVWGSIDEDGRVVVLVDDAGSGVDHVEYSRDGQQWHGSLTEALGAVETSDAPLQRASTLQVRAFDVAGNVSDPLMLSATDPIAPYAIAPGARVMIVANGFEPDATVRVELRPIGIALSELVADESGVVSDAVVLPDPLPDGVESLALVQLGSDAGPGDGDSDGDSGGADSGGSGPGAGADVEVPVELPATGADSTPLVVLAGILLAAGALVCLLRARRRADFDA